MTPSEAIQHIKRHIEVHRIKEPQAIYITEALKMARDALEKQIAKKATPYKVLVPPTRFANPNWHKVYKCPCCGTYISSCDYCNNCGQALDWDNINT